MIENYQPELVVENAKLSLYAFHLCYDISSEERKPRKDSAHIWEIFEKLGQELGIEALSKFQGYLKLPNKIVQFQELFSNRYLPFSFPSTCNTDNVENPIPHRKGELYALQIHDTYAADLTFRYPEKVSVEQLSHLNPQGKLLPDYIQASIGQTLVFYAKPIIKDGNKDGNLPPEEGQNFANLCVKKQDFAYLCVKNLLAEAAEPWHISYLGECKLLSSPIFIYETYQESPEDPPKDSCQILIWLDCHPETSKLEKEGEYYHSLINLLCCRSKIQLSYYQARNRYREAKKLYQELENKIEDVKKNLPKDISEKLDKLNEFLIDISNQSFDYASYLRDILDQQTTIITNYKNHTTFLNQLQQIKGENELSFFKTFSRGSPYNKLIKQINTDLNYLTPGRHLFGEYIQTVRGIIDIEQAKIEHQEQEDNQRLQDQIQAIGVGVGTGAIISSCFALATERPWYWPNGQKIELPQFINLHPFIVALLSSFLLAYGAWWMTIKLINYQRRKKAEKKEINTRIEGAAQQSAIAKK